MNYLPTKRSFRLEHLPYGRKWKEVVFRSKFCFLMCVYNMVLMLCGSYKKIWV